MNEIKFELESDKLTSYLESWLEDFQDVAREMLNKVSEEKEMKLNIPENEMSRLKALSLSIDALSKKKFVVENSVDFSSIVSALKAVETSLSGFKIPESVKVDMPKFELPTGATTTVDLSPLQEQIRSLETVLASGIHVNNLEEIPLVFPKTIDVKKDGLNLGLYDYVSVEYTNATTENYTFKSGGASGTIVARVTLVYTDSSKENISSVTKI